MGEWQPIETAPRDGTRIRLWHNQSHEGYATTGEWDGKEWTMCNYFISTDRRMFTQPNVWLPLPPPSAREGEG